MREDEGGGRREIGGESGDRSKGKEGREAGEEQKSRVGRDFLSGKVLPMRTHLHPHNPRVWITHGRDLRVGDIWIHG